MQMDGDQSGNIEDRRSDDSGGGRRRIGRRLPDPDGRWRRRLFKGGFGLVAFVVIAMIMGADPGSILSDVLGGGGGGASYAPAPALRQPYAGHAGAGRRCRTQFVSRVLKSTEDVWGHLPRLGGQYREPKLVLFRNATQTECGVGQAAMGPFYCPADQRVYLDLGFFDELARRFHAPGQFPQAYVIAHEIGHHVQKLLGISDKVQQMRQSMSRRDGNALSVRTELQADCFAGVWANRADKQRGGKMIDDKDIEQAHGRRDARSATTRCSAEPGPRRADSFTHGSSAQRSRWFRIGLDSGDPRQQRYVRAQQL